MDSLTSKTKSSTQIVKCITDLEIQRNNFNTVLNHMVQDKEIFITDRDKSVDFTLNKIAHNFEI